MQSRRGVTEEITEVVQEEIQEVIIEEPQAAAIKEAPAPIVVEPQECQVKDCPLPPFKHSLCKKHFYRKQNLGDAEYVPPSHFIDFRAKPHKKGIGITVAKLNKQIERFK